MVTTNRSDRGSNKPRGAERFERDDVIRDPIRGLHQGQQPSGAAQTGRTHGCTRPVLVAARKLLHRRGRPHMAPTTTSSHSYAGAGAVHPITSHVSHHAEIVCHFRTDMRMSVRCHDLSDDESVGDPSSFGRFNRIGVKVMNCKQLLLGTVLAMGMAPAVASAATVFSEDFSGAMPGTYGPGVIPGTKFSVDTRNVDITGELNGSYYSCDSLKPGGNCLDLLGDQGLGGSVTSTSFALTAGVLYTLAFDAAGAGGNTCSAMVAGFSQTFATNADGSVSHQSFTFTPLSSTSTSMLVFRDLTAPNAYNGAVLANINLTGASIAAAVPEPAS